MPEAILSRRAMIGGTAVLALPSVAVAEAPGEAALGRRDGRWLNPPRRWHAEDNGEMTLVTDRATDFWRETHYGFTRDSGHFLGFPTPAAFTAQLRVRGAYKDLYD